MEDISQLIANVGFPIAAFVMMFYMCNTTIKENTKALAEINLTISKFHGKEMKEGENEK